MKKILTFFGVVLALVVGYLGAGAYLSVSEIKKGIAQGDLKRLSLYIDFPALKENIKKQLDVSVMKNAASKKDSFSILAAGFAMNATDRMVDYLITLKGLTALMEGKNPLKDKTREKSLSDFSKKDLFKDAKFSYDSVDRFSVLISDEDGENIRFIFQLKGLKWKLVNIILPLGR